MFRRARHGSSVLPALAALLTLPAATCATWGCGSDGAVPPQRSACDGSTCADEAASEAAPDAPADTTTDAVLDVPIDAVVDDAAILDADADTDADTDAAEDAGSDAAPPPPIGNALLLANDVVTGLYPVTDPTSSIRAVAFLSDGQSVRCLDEDGSFVWSEPLGAGALFGGFDFDADGWTDVGLARSEDTGQLCGTSPLMRTWIELVSGKTGESYAPVAPEEGICWNFSGTIYPTDQWGVLGVLFGASSATLALAPYYATTGSFLTFAGSGFNDTGTFIYPSTDTYDATYVADLPNAHGTGHSYEQYSHVANGLMVEVAGEERLAFFTTGRVLQYRLGPLGPDQLVDDAPFLTANRTDLVGRDYGLVMQDPELPRLLILISGTSADTMLSDMQASSMQADPWGQIERHVTIYDLEAGALVQDRFFSYAHDANDGYKYEGRVVYPNNPVVRRGAGLPSRLAFNVYEGGHWQLHVTDAGNANDAAVFKDWYLWDIRDLDLDGTEDWILSPSRDPSDPDVPGWYFVKWRTVFAHWEESSVSFVQTREEQGAIPYLAPTFRLPRQSTSRGYLYPALTAEVNGALKLLLWTSSGGLTTVSAQVP